MSDVFRWILALIVYISTGLYWWRRSDTVCISVGPTLLHAGVALVNSFAALLKGCRANGFSVGVIVGFLFVNLPVLLMIRLLCRVEFTTYLRFLPKVSVNGPDHKERASARVDERLPTRTKIIVRLCFD